MGEHEVLQKQWELDMGYELHIERSDQEITKQQWRQAVKASDSLRLGKRETAEVNLAGNWVPVFRFISGQVTFKPGTGHTRNVMTYALELAEFLDARVVSDEGEEYKSPDQLTMEPDVECDDPGIVRAIKKNLKNESPSLSLEGRFLKSLPGSIEQLEHLIELNVFDNEISQLPRWIGNLRNLEFLNLEANRLASLPDEMGQLHHLRMFRLRVNQLESLPDSLGECRSMERLDIGWNPIVRLPETIGNLVNLEELMAVECHLESLPNSIGNLENLRSLYLNINHLKTLPNSVCRLANLRTLNLENNALTELPTELGQLQNLRYLDLTGNRLESLPESMRELDLVRLQLHENDALGIPSDVLGPTDDKSDCYDDFGVILGTSPKSILDWYFDQGQ